MTEVAIDVDIGSKRRLPTWMLRVDTGDEPKKSGNGDGLRLSLEENSTTQAIESKKKPLSRKRDRGQVTESSERSGTLQMCERKQRIRKASKQDEGHSDCIPNFGESKKKLKKGSAVGERDVTVPRKQNVKTKRPQNDAIQVVLDKNTDEVELTVEDLMSIAEEYINADREKQRGQLESTSETDPLSLSNSSGINTTRHFQANGLSQILSKCMMTSCSSQQSETNGKEKEDPSIKNIVTNIRRTGDAAQDMLDLFLGPLLKKPPPKEWEIGAIETEGLVSVRESNVQVRSREMPKEEGFLEKKKSSLKDKVALFL